MNSKTLKSSPSFRLRLVVMGALLVSAGLISTAYAQLPAVQSAQGVNYVTGGFGTDESGAFKQSKSQYPVSLTFAATGPDGSTPYVAQVKVDIVDAQGETVVSIPSAGPYLLVDLPNGSYTVKASYEGQERTQDITVSGPGSADVRIAWPRPTGGPD